MTFTNKSFLKRKDILESKFLVSVNYSFNHLMEKISLCEYITGGVNTYYMDVSV